MLKLSSDQVAVFEERAEQDFLARVQTFCRPLRADLSDDNLEKTLIKEIRAARAWGLKSERTIAEYCALSVQARSDLRAFLKKMHVGAALQKTSDREFSRTITRRSVTAMLDQQISEAGS